MRIFLDYIVQISAESVQHEEVHGAEIVTKAVIYQVRTSRKISIWCGRAIKRKIRVVVDYMDTPKDAMVDKFHAGT